MQYVKNTHAATHNTYTLEVQEVSGLWKTLTQIVCARCDFCCAVLLLLCMKYCVVFDPPILHTKDLQDWAAGRTSAFPSLRGAAQPAAAVARFSGHQLRWYFVSGSSHRSPRSSGGEFIVCFPSHLHCFLLLLRFSLNLALPFLFTSFRLVTCLAKVCTLPTWCPRAQTTVTPRSQTPSASCCWLRSLLEICMQKPSCLIFHHKIFLSSSA